MFSFLNFVFLHNIHYHLTITVYFLKFYFLPSLHVSNSMRMYSALFIAVSLTLQ